MTRQQCVLNIYKNSTRLTKYEGKSENPTYCTKQTSAKVSFQKQFRGTIVVWLQVWSLLLHSTHYNT